MKRKQRIYIPHMQGLHGLPGKVSDFLWDYDPGYKPLPRAEVEAMFADYQRRKAKLDEEERIAAAKRFAIATAEVNQDRRQLLILKEWERREQFFKDDAEQTAAYVAQLMKFEDDQWRKQAAARLRKVTAKIKTSDERAAKKAVREKLERLGKPVRRQVTWKPNTP